MDERDPQPGRRAANGRAKRGGRAGAARPAAASDEDLCGAATAAREARDLAVRRAAAALAEGSAADVERLVRAARGLGALAAQMAAEGDAGAAGGAGDGGPGEPDAETARRDVLARIERALFPPGAADDADVADADGGEEWDEDENRDGESGY